MKHPLIIAIVGMALLALVAYMVYRSANGKVERRQPTKLDGRSRPYDRMPDGRWK